MDIDGNKILRELSVIAFFFVFIFLLISLATYSSQDPSFNQYLGPDVNISNGGGIIGAYLAGLLVEFLGIASWMIPLIFLLLGIGSLTSRFSLAWYRWLGIFLLFICLTCAGAFPWLKGYELPGDIQGGGYLGETLLKTGVSFLHYTGFILLWLFLLVVGVQLFLRISWAQIIWRIKNSTQKIGQGFFRLGQKIQFGKKTTKTSNKSKRKSLPGKKQVLTEKKSQSGQKASSSKQEKSLQPVEVSVDQNKGLNYDHYSYPPSDLLDAVTAPKLSEEELALEEQSEKLTDCLLDFNIHGEVVNVRPGPVVTMFEFKPAPGIKISKIANLSDDIALALKALSVRIEAPIPGKDSVGIEVPNKKRRTVFFREIIDSQAFIRTSTELPIVLGQDIQGGARVENLVKMPHLLVAGATGAGKSVCLNSILVSLLFKASPEELKFLLIDPKRIEMASYSELPHLVHPVVTEMDLAKTALDWAVYQMDKRYESMAQLSVRNIVSYNQKLKELKEKRNPDVQDLEYMPYLVIIIDELSDLMLTAGKEAEASIVRLAQLARASGIHLILATQRPSVDVVTGLIKANFPARIAFQVSSKHDSRTILDASGAQCLLGKGDMLYKTSAGRLERIHGTYISDKEINATLDFWKKKYDLERELDLKQWQNETKGPAGQENSDIMNDPLYQQAVDFVLDQGKASISMIQRQLRIGFNRAAKFVEQMEYDGVIGPQEGSKPRTVIK